MNSLFDEIISHSLTKNFVILYLFDHLMDSLLNRQKTINMLFLSRIVHTIID